MRDIRAVLESRAYNNINNPRAFDLSISTIHIIISCYIVYRYGRIVRNLNVK